MNLIDTLIKKFLIKNQIKVFKQNIQIEKLPNIGHPNLIKYVSEKYV